MGNVIRFPIERTKASQEVQEVLRAFKAAPPKGDWREFIATGHYVPTPDEDEAF